MAKEMVTSRHSIVGAVVRPSKVPVMQEACLVVLYGQSIGRRIALTESAVVIGRSTDADLQFEEEAVSRTHCRIEPFTDPMGVDRWRVVDLKSTNGTFVNDRSVRTQTLQHGDRLQVGRTICKFLGTGEIEAAYYEEIYRLVTTDGLTGLANRRAFSECIAREFGRAVRYGRPLSLASIDIDFFKKINDDHGHLAGDAALRQLGLLLRNNLRKEDGIGRLGGEEFAVVLPEIDIEGARVVAEKIRRLVASRGFEYDGELMQFSISVGVVTRTAADRDADDLMRRGDEMLYAAKRNGRNRVEG